MLQLMRVVVEQLTNNDSGWERFQTSYHGSLPYGTPYTEHDEEAMQERAVHVLGQAAILMAGRDPRAHLKITVLDNGNHRMVYIASSDVPVDNPNLRYTVDFIDLK